MPEGYTVAGAGPAGAAFAYYAGLDGLPVTVYDPAPRPGFKPCGWAVPIQIERLIDIPGEAILTRIRGFRVYLNGRLIHDQRGETWGYIVDKPHLLESLLAYSKLVKRAVRIRHDCHGGIHVEGVDRDRRVVVAIGHPLHSSCRDADRIYAVQYVDQKLKVDDPEIIEVHYDGSLVGYYWVFPRGDRGVDVGVGGYEPPGQLLARLKKFLRERFNVKPSQQNIRGAPINVAGVDTRLLDGQPPVIGEAAGFVYPLSGEGIRPSIMSAKALYTSIAAGGKPSRYARDTIRWIRIQRLLLNRAVKTSRETRERLLETLPLDLFIGLGLGELTGRDLLRLARHLPASLARIVNTLIR